ncbi:MAG: hypothetical protein HPY50_19040 [Firmicutes bacterium]|nr:hypothetical protein [Bacillota bacterium]
MRKSLTLLVMVLTVFLPLPGSAAAAPVVLVDGQRLLFDVPLVIEQGRVMVPLRGIADALGAKVGWEASTRTIELVQGNTSLRLQIGNLLAMKNDRRLQLDAAPQIINNRTLVPLRFISEAFGASVAWNGATRTVSINRVPDEEPVDSLEKQVFDLANAARAEHGLPPFKWDSRLAEVARQHSRDMRDQGFFSHNSPDGSPPFDRMNSAGLVFSAAAENIAVGYRTAEEAHEGWMNSPGHRANILGDCEYLGVGVVYGGEYGVYYTQNFYTPQ